MADGTDNWNARAIYALTLLTLIQALNYFDRAILGLVLPLIKQELHSSDTILGLIAGFAFALFNVALTIPIARLADRGSRRNIVAAGLFFWSLTTALTGLVTNVWQLAIARFLMGAGEAAGVAPSNSIVADLFTPRRRTLTISILTAGGALGTIIFTPIGGWLAQHHGWRAPFIAAGLPGIALAAIFLLTVREPKRGETAAGQVEIAEGFGQTIGFLMGSRAYIFLLLGASMVSASMAITLSWWAAFLVRVHHLPLTDVGLITGPVRGIMQLVALVAGGMLTDWLSTRKAHWAMTIPAICAFLFAPASLLLLFGTSIPAVIAGVGLSALFLSGTQGPAIAACSVLAKPRMRAMSVAIFLFASYLVGYALGPLAVGYLNDVLKPAFGDEAIRYSLLIGIVVTLLGGGFYLASSRFIAEDAKRASH